MIQISLPGSGKLNKSQIIWERKRGTRTVQGDPGSRCQEPGRRGRGRGVGRALRAMGGTNPRREETGSHEAGPPSQESQGCPEYFLPGPVLAAQPLASFILNQRAHPQQRGCHLISILVLTELTYTPKSIQNSRV